MCIVLLVFPPNRSSSIWLSFLKKQYFLDPWHFSNNLICQPVRTDLESPICRIFWHCQSDKESREQMGRWNHFSPTPRSSFQAFTDLEKSFLLFRSQNWMETRKDKEWPSRDVSCRLRWHRKSISCPSPILPVLPLVHFFPFLHRMLFSFSCSPPARCQSTLFYWLFALLVLLRNHLQTDDDDAKKVKPDPVITENLSFLSMHFLVNENPETSR